MALKEPNQTYEANVRPKTNCLANKLFEVFIKIAVGKATFGCDTTGFISKGKKTKSKPAQNDDMKNFPVKNAEKNTASKKQY